MWNVFFEFIILMTQNAGQYDYLDPWLMQRLAKKTMTQSSWIQTLGVAFQSRITVAFCTVFTGLYLLYARDKRLLSKVAKKHICTKTQVKLMWSWEISHWCWKWDHIVLDDTDWWQCCFLTAKTGFYFHLLYLSLLLVESLYLGFCGKYKDLAVKSGA